METADRIGPARSVDDALEKLDLETVERLSDRLWFDLPASHPHALAQLMRRVPAAELERHPRVLLAVYQALEFIRPEDPALPRLLQFYAAQGSRYAVSLETYLRPGDVVAAGMIALIGARVRGDYAESEAMAHRLDGRLGGSSSLSLLPWSDARLGGRPGWLPTQRALTAMLDGRFDDAIRHARDGYHQMGEPPSHHFAGANAAADAAMLAALGGYTEMTFTWLQRLADAGPVTPRVEHLVAAPAHVARAMIAIDRLEREEARTHLLALGSPAGPLEIWPFVALTWARYERMFGSITTGMQRLHEAAYAHGAMQRQDQIAGGLLMRARAELMLQAGEANAVLALAAEHGSVRARISVPLARAHLRSGYLTQAVRISSPPTRRPDTHPRDSLEHHLILAAAQLQRGARDDAADLFQRAWELYELTGIRAAFVEVDPRDLDELCRLIGVHSPLPADVSPPLRTTTLIRLSPREQVVLRALSSEDTSKAIAEHLSVSVNTVRSQVRSIYRKLGVSTRDDAVAVAARHGLIDRVLPARGARPGRGRSARR